MPAVLSIGHDAVLLTTRASLLRQAEVEVTSIAPVDVSQALSSKNYSLVILCHSLRRSEAEEIASTVKMRSTNCSILLLSRDNIEGLIDGIEVCSAHRPDALLRVVRRLIKR